MTRGLKEYWNKLYNFVQVRHCYTISVAGEANLK